MVREPGGELLVRALHIDVTIVRGTSQHKPARTFENNASVSLWVDVRLGGNLERDLAYGHANELWGNATGDVRTDVAIEMTVRLTPMPQILPVNPLGLVDIKEKRRIVYGLTCSDELGGERGVGG